MMEELVETELDSRAVEYLRYVLRNGHKLAELVLRDVNLTEGQIRTVLWQGCPIDDLYKFSSGGKTLRTPPSLETGKGAASVVPIVSLVRPIAKRLAALLSSIKDGVLLLEDVVALRTDGSVSRLTPPPLFYSNFIYHFAMSDQATPPRIERAMKLASSLPFAWGLLSSIDIQIQKRLLASRELTLSDLEILAANCEALLVGAYDGESYLLWERNGRKKTDS